MKTITVTGNIIIKEYKSFEIDVDDNFNTDDIEELREKFEEEVRNDIARGLIDGDNLTIDLDMVR